MAEKRKNRRLSGVTFFHGAESRFRFFGNFRLFGFREAAPGGAAEAHHLMQHAIALSREGNSGNFRGNFGARLVSGGHGSSFALLKLISRVSACGYCTRADVRRHAAVMAHRLATGRNLSRYSLVFGSSHIPI